MKKITLLFLALTGMLANAQTTLYTENFESNFGYTTDITTTFKPSTKYGTWSGGKDLTTAGDVDAGIRRGWSTINLSINSTQPAVTIANINVAGYTGLSLTYVNVMTSTPAAPFIEASIDGGITWTTLPTVATGGSYSRETKVVALPAGTYSTISLRINPPAAGVGDQILDDFVIKATGTLGVQNFDELVSLKTYTNDGNVVVECAENIKNVSIYSISGQVVANVAANSTTVSIPTNNLSKGVYMVKVDTENGSKTVKIVK